MEGNDEQEAIDIDEINDNGVDLFEVTSALQQTEEVT